MTWRKTAIYTGFPNYIHAFICVKSLDCLQDKELRVIVLLYMDVYMQCVYAFVRGYVDECGMWFWLSYYMVYKIEFNNRDTKSKSKIEIQNQIYIFKFDFIIIMCKWGWKLNCEIVQFILKMLWILTIDFWPIKH